jgi:hypothetical protein
MAVPFVAWPYEPSAVDGHPEAEPRDLVALSVARLAQ